jgi:hypothetical protein
LQGFHEWEATMGIRSLFEPAEIHAVVRREEPGGGGTFIAIVFQQERLAWITNDPGKI